MEGKFKLIANDVISDGNDQLRLASPVLNATRIDDLCASVLKCVDEARDSYGCEDCNHSVVSSFDIDYWDKNQSYIIFTNETMYEISYINIGDFRNKYFDESCLRNLGLVDFSNISGYIFYATGSHCADIWP